MPRGIFFGTCEAERFQHMITKDGREVYSTGKDFTYKLAEEAVPAAYHSSLRHERSLSIVACLTDDRFLGWDDIPDHAVKFFEILDSDGMDKLLEFYRENAGRIPDDQKEDLVDKHCKNILRAYLKKDAK